MSEILACIPQQPGLGQVRTDSEHSWLSSHVACKVLPLESSPTASPGTLAGSWIGISSWGSNRDFSMGCCRCKQWLYPLHHNAGPWRALLMYRFGQVLRENLLGWVLEFQISWNRTLWVIRKQPVVRALWGKCCSNLTSPLHAVYVQCFPNLCSSNYRSKVLTVRQIICIPKTNYKRCYYFFERKKLTGKKLGKCVSVGLNLPSL